MIDELYSAGYRLYSDSFRPAVRSAYHSTEQTQQRLCHVLRIQASVPISKL
jgi:hypothetical protein